MSLVTPPCSMCPVCGNLDLDVVKGKAICNGCGCHMVFRATIEVQKWEGQPIPLGDAFYSRELKKADYQCWSSWKTLTPIYALDAILATGM